MSLTIAIPHLFWSSEKNAVPAFALTGLAHLRHWGKWAPLSVSNESFYQHYAWNQSILDLAKKEFNLPLSCCAFLCTPLHQEVGMHQANFTMGKSLAIDKTEALSYCQLLNDFFKEDGWQFYAWKNDQWLVTLPNPCDFLSPSLLDLQGIMTELSKPTGVGANIIMRKQTEIQMVLFQAKLNQTRLQQNKLTITDIAFSLPKAKSLENQIFWYQADSWRFQSESNNLLPNSYSQLKKSDLLTKDTILFFNGLTEAKLNQNFTDYQQQLQQWDNNWFMPLFKALQAKELRQLKLVTNGLNGGVLTISKPFYSFLKSKPNLLFTGAWI